MSAILIVDAFKASKVMTSEVFKDKLLNAVIYISESAKDCLDLVEKKQFDMIVVDFDLPDADGTTLVRLLRKTYHGPILLTAFPEPHVEQAIRNELFPYQDASDWLKKPINTEELSAKIDKFLIQGQRLRKRFVTTIAATLLGSSAGRGKRVEKVKGQIANIGIGGAMIKVEGQWKLKVGEEVALNIQGSLAHFELVQEPSTVLQRKPKAAATKTLNDDSSLVLNKNLSKIKATIAWANKAEKQAGLKFHDLSEPHRKALEELLKGADVRPEVSSSGPQD